MAYLNIYIDVETSQSGAIRNKCLLQSQIKIFVYVHLHYVINFQLASSIN